jgi:SAM-dependent methyltransferase
MAPTFSSAMASATNYNGWIVDQFSPFIGSTVMEIGIGHGNFAALVMKHARRYVGVDIDPKLVEQAKSANPQHRYIVADVTAPSLAVETSGMGIDTILACNVLEHVQEDAKAVRQLLASLPKGGHLLIFVPAFEALLNGMDRLAGHHRRYTRKSLAAIIPSETGEIVRMAYVNPIGGLGWWVSGRLNPDIHELDQINGQIALFDRYIFPVSRLLSPLFSRIFGQSLVCVVRRR